jgi:hypothetical protein
MCRFQSALLFVKNGHNIGRELHEPFGIFTDRSFDAQIQPTHLGLPFQKRKYLPRSIRQRIVDSAQKPRRTRDLTGLTLAEVGRWRKPVISVEI